MLTLEKIPFLPLQREVLLSVPCVMYCHLFNTKLFKWGKITLFLAAHHLKLFSITFDTRTIPLSAQESYKDFERNFVTVLQRSPGLLSLYPRARLACTNLLGD